MGVGVDLLKYLRTFFRAPIIELFTKKKKQGNIKEFSSVFHFHGLVRVLGEKKNFSRGVFVFKPVTVNFSFRNPKG